MKKFKKFLIENEQDSWSKDPELLKLTRKAMASIAGSQKQKELIKQLNVLRKKHGLEPLKESAQNKTYIVVNKHNPKEKYVIKAENDFEMLEKVSKTKLTLDNMKAQIQFFQQNYTYTIQESNTLDERCWDGYKPTPGKKPYEKGSCMKEDDIQEDAEHEGKSVTLNKPFRTPDGPKKFAVYVKNDKGNVVKVTFGDPNMEIKRDSDDRRANFRARHNCDDPGPKWKARYWSCKMWSNKPVSKLAEASENSYDFKMLDGPRTKKVSGGMSGLRGLTPEDAIKQRMIAFGYRNISITQKDGVFSVKAQWGSNPKDTELSYYSVSESVVDNDVSSAAKLFSKFLRSTGAPDKVTAFVPKQSNSKTLFVGKSSNSQFDYAVDVLGGTVTITDRGSIKNKSFVWNDKTGKLKITEEAPPDSNIEKWIKDNKTEFTKQYGEEKGKQILYATAWKMYNKK